MAVYTNLNEDQVKHFLKRYEIGDLISFSGITEGIENTNFNLKTSKGNYILTIFEKRVEVKDIPFFIKVMLHLNKKGYYCPKPICDKKNNFLQDLNGKPTIIVNFLQGKSKENFSTSQLNKLLNKFVNASAPPSVAGRQLKFKHIHFAGTYPTTFIIHSNQDKKIPANYKKYLENSFREELHLNSVQLKLIFRKSSNPFDGKKNKLSNRQTKKRQRLIKHKHKSNN